MADRSVLEYNGMSFENMIARHLKSKYPESEVLHNRELFSPYLKKTTQIDLILLHPKGIFVIEAKNWKKWCRGGYDNAFWFGQGMANEVLQAYNPLNQNFIHIRALRNAIRTETGVEPVAFHNVVCFPNSTILETECIEVVHLSFLHLYLEKLMIAERGVLDIAQWKNLIERVTVPGHK